MNIMVTVLCADIRQVQLGIYGYLYKYSTLSTPTVKITKLVHVYFLMDDDLYCLKVKSVTKKYFFMCIKKKK